MFRPWRAAGGARAGRCPGTSAFWALERARRRATRAGCRSSPRDPPAKATLPHRGIRDPAPASVTRAPRPPDPTVSSKPIAIESPAATYADRAMPHRPPHPPAAKREVLPSRRFCGARCAGRRDRWRGARRRAPCEPTLRDALAEPRTRTARARRAPQDRAKTIPPQAAPSAQRATDTAKGGIRHVVRRAIELSTISRARRGRRHDRRFLGDHRFTLKAACSPSTRIDCASKSSRVTRSTAPCDHVGLFVRSKRREVAPPLAARWVRAPAYGVRVATRAALTALHGHEPATDRDRADGPRPRRRLDATRTARARVPSRSQPARKASAR